jgi:hypothetical protein
MNAEHYLKSLVGDSRIVRAMVLILMLAALILLITRRVKRGRSVGAGNAEDTSQAWPPASRTRATRYQQVILLCFTILVINLLVIVICSIQAMLINGPPNGENQHLMLLVYLEIVNVALMVLLLSIYLQVKKNERATYRLLSSIHSFLKKAMPGKRGTDAFVFCTVIIDRYLDKNDVDTLLRRVAGSKKISPIMLGRELVQEIVTMFTRPKSNGVSCAFQLTTEGARLLVDIQEAMRDSITNNSV